MGGYNNFPRIFTQGLRFGYDSAVIRKGMRDTIKLYWKPNNYVIDPWCGIEKSGGIEAINSILLDCVGSNGNQLWFFPGWDKKTTDASFKRLRAKRAFVVDASLRNGVVGDVRIVSE